MKSWIWEVHLFDMSGLFRGMHEEVEASHQTINAMQHSTLKPRTRQSMQHSTLKPRTRQSMQCSTPLHPISSFFCYEI